jgi:hypothetical protein
MDNKLMDFFAISLDNFGKRLLILEEKINFIEAKECGHKELVDIAMRNIDEIGQRLLDVETGMLNCQNELKNIDRNLGMRIATIENKVFLMEVKSDEHKSN